jgi:cytochrome P450
LRMYPVVPGNTREAACDTILPVGGGADGRSPIFVKKGTPVFYNLYAMHRRPDIYGNDAEEFVPERWEGLRPGWGFLPFNGGPRICLGRKLPPSPVGSRNPFSRPLGFLRGHAR